MLAFNPTPCTATYATRVLLSLLNSFPPSLRHLTILIDCTRPGTTFPRDLPWAELIAFCKRPTGAISLDVVIWQAVVLVRDVRLTDDPALGDRLQELQERGVLHAHWVEKWDERRCGPDCS